MTLRSTDSDRKLVNFIISYTDKHGFPPSRRLIAEHLECGPSMAQRRLERLVREGVIQRAPGVPRGIRVDPERIRQFGGQ